MVQKPLSLRLLEERAGDRPFVDVAEAALLTGFSAQSIRNRSSASSPHPLPFAVIKMGRSRNARLKVHVDTLRDYLLTIEDEIAARLHCVGDIQVATGMATTSPQRGGSPTTTL